MPEHRKKPGPKPGPPEDRFWGKVKKGDLCWVWTASCTPAGYGMFHIKDRRRVPAHRFAYELLVGPIPDRLVLDHLCRNTRCVNPDHLEIVTERENVVVRGHGATAVNARKTHCPQGHPYDEENTHYRPNGHRVCRTCKRARDRRRDYRTIAHLAPTAHESKREEKESPSGGDSVRGG